MIAMNGSSFGRRGGAALRYPGGTECFRILATLAVDPEQTTRCTLVHPLNMARPTHPAIQIHRIHLPTLCSSTSGVRLRNFTPRRSDYPTDSMAILSPGFTSTAHDPASAPPAHHDRSDRPPRLRTGVRHRRDRSIIPARARPLRRSPPQDQRSKPGATRPYPSATASPPPQTPVPATPIPHRTA